MLPITKHVEILEGITLQQIPQEILLSEKPLLLKGLVRPWPLVQAGLQSVDAADAYLRRFYNDKTVNTFIGDPDIAGRYFYNQDMSGLNFKTERHRLDDVLDLMHQHDQDENPPALYVGSTTIDACLPGFREENDIPLPVANPLASIWIGNPSRIACHFDAPDNLACCVVGQRRFTLFPPEQIVNLYPGPVDFNPAGQQISLVDFANPDHEKFPRFREAMAQGLVANMEPGDVLFVPSMWWHHVEALSRFNVLVNYWWRLAPAFMGPGINVLKHAMLGLRDLPEKEKAAWKALFDFYIFGPQDRTRDAIPQQVQGVLAPIDDMQARQLRAWLINRLNR